MIFEHEVKFLDINVVEIEKKLKKIGAVKKGDYFFRSMAFDYPDFSLDKKFAWLRLRDEVERVTLAYKKRLGVKSSGGDDDGMEEVEVEVSDYKKTAQIIMNLGFILKFAQEKKRTKWVKDGVIFDIDTWPRLKTYLEIEGENEVDVDKGIKWLGLDKKDAKRFSTTQVYELNGIRDKDYIKMTFEEFVRRG